jgi:purine nucleosidase
MTKIILDTDIGTDVDDILALCLLLASPEAELIGVTTAYGDTRLRAKIVHQVLALTRRAGKVPIVAGNPEPLTPSRTVFWAGHEGQNLEASIPETVTVETNAEDFILQSVEQHPGEVTLVAIAPLGNIARAIQKSLQAMQGVKQIYIMGGNFNLQNTHFPAAEHNITSDPEAARVVFESGLPIVLFPLDVTTKTHFGKQEVEQLQSATSELAQLVYSEVNIWMNFVRKRFGRDLTHMHDPLTLAALLNPAIITRSECVGINIEPQGKYTTGMTLPNPHHPRPNVQVVFDIDVQAFDVIFLERVLEAIAKST